MCFSVKFYLFCFIVGMILHFELDKISETNWFWGCLVNYLLVTIIFVLNFDRYDAFGHKPAFTKDIISDILGLKFDHIPLSFYRAIRFMVIKIHLNGHNYWALLRLTSRLAFKECVPKVHINLFTILNVLLVKIQMILYVLLQNNQRSKFKLSYFDEM